MRVKKWFVVYTKSRAEKKVFQQMQELEIESFLPLQKTIRQWSDRKKTVEVPMFNSYVFVHIYEYESTKVKSIPGVVTFISFKGELAVVPDQEIKNLQLIVAGQIPVDISQETFKKGDFVEVDRGALKGLRGNLIHYNGKYKVLIRIDIINQNILVEIPVTHLQKVYSKSA